MVERNFEGIQFEKLRRVVDPKFNVVHDELSDCYYNETPFREYGILDKETFDKLHGLIFLMRDTDFHQENIKQPAEDRIPEKKYNDIRNKGGEIVGKRSDRSDQRISELKIDGIEITIP